MGRIYKIGAVGVLVLFLIIAIATSFLFFSFLGVIAVVTPNSGESSRCLSSTNAVSVVEGSLPDSFENLNASQIEVAATIMKIGEEVGVGERGQLIGLMTAMQESGLGLNTVATGTGGDAGVFQQRTAPGWYGTVDEVNDPAYGARIFYEGKTVTEDVAGAAGPPGYHIPGLKDIEGWEAMPLTDAAQAVQRSNYPEHYAKHEHLMRRLMAELGNLDGVTLNYKATGSSCNSDTLDASATFIDGDPNAQGFIHPTVRGSLITSPFGMRLHPVYGIEKQHEGVDFNNTCGTVIYAVKDGVVHHSGRYGTAGLAVNITHAGGVESHNYHLQTTDVTAGQTVKQGQRIGLVGTTGVSTGCHLHFGIKVNGRFVDPMPFIN